MRYGFVTNCLGDTNIEDAVAVAREIGLDCIEVGPSVRRALASFREVQYSSDVEIHSFIYGRNFLSRDRKEREEFRSELWRLLDFASDIGVGQITTSTGVDPTLDLQGNINAALDFWQRIFDDAKAANVKIALEFCPASGNFALGPYAWRRLLAATQTYSNFGLNYDPSHLRWQFIDPYRPIHEFASHIFSVHAKDAVVWQDRLSEHGILTPYSHSERTPHGSLEERALWWAYRVPGEGDLHWPTFIHELQQSDYDGAILIEHEDSRYLGSRQSVLEGLKRALDHLRLSADAACQLGD